ncbi:hypothetical protein [Pseudomonas juntendi]|uniref:hypothetical protein n=1 Tax=Pseudomonas juntendi TaxID=2666183 RepID=UPI0024489C75|nr:hypothetical protein [Pseudomonas juntendi]MDG9888153.1 hypothetical protein [Pseudomonas juntendi]
MIDSKEKAFDATAKAQVSESGNGEPYDVNLDDRGSVATFITSSFDKITAAQLLAIAQEEA